MSDAERGRLARLVVRAQGGEREAMDALLLELQEPLLRHVRAIVREEQLAEDTLQEVLWIVCRKIGRLQDPRWVRAWSFRIATREAVRRSQRERGRLEAIADESYDHVAAPEVEPLFEATLVERLPALLRSLSPGSEVVLRLHYLDGLTIAEIAEALELPPGTVKSRLAYGLQSLRHTVGPDAPTT